MTGSPEDLLRAEDHYFRATQRWLHRNDVRSLVLVCRGGQSAPLGTKRRPCVEVAGCLQELSLSRLVDLSLAGVQSVAVTPGPCCSTEDALTVVDRWQETLGALLSLTVIDPEPGRNWSWSLSPTRVPVDRRGLLGLRQATPAWPTHDASTDDHERLLTSLRAAGVTPAGTPPSRLTLLASGCTACGVCVAACPHNALALVIDSDEASLVHSLDACHGEQQCVALCPVDALTVSGSPSWAEVIDGAPRVLATVETAVCERCRARFPARSGSQWCEPCRIRRSDPFGSHLPAEAIELLKARGHDHRR